MKANFVSTRVVKAVAALVTTVVLFISNPLTSQAAPINEKAPVALKTSKVIPESQVSIEYAGYNEGNVIFSVKFENPSAERFWLILKDDAGEVIYRQAFNDVHFSKAIYLEKGDLQIHPTFIIRKGNEESVHAFAVNLSTKELVSVTKL